MSERTNRKELILQTAMRLFEQQGYQATATRQIAEEVGCTEAALYYHFKDGKHALLHAVMEARLPQVQQVMDQCSQATSLKQAMMIFGSNFANRTPGMRWIMSELGSLSDEERTLILSTFDRLRNNLAGTIRPFVDSDEAASRIAWLMMCIGAGYQQLFSETAFANTVDITMHDVMSTLFELME